MKKLYRRDPVGSEVRLPTWPHDRMAAIIWKTWMLRTYRSKSELIKVLKRELSVQRTESYKRFTSEPQLKRYQETVTELLQELQTNYPIV